ncbi:MAG: hypothetical protein CSA39_01905 [Flavobacteriales bacterium]|nr:MAG: hypothetical protein CSA39_01905 [Flavobacteriales bacterium]
MKFLPILFVSLVCLCSNAQIEKKQVTALKTSVKPIIDGNLDDECWQHAATAQNFVMFKPKNGTPERLDKKTTVKLLYDDEAIYFAAYLYDNTTDKIPLQYENRDQIGNVDYFAVLLNPNNDGQNDSGFFVMSTGAQADCKIDKKREDFSWNAVWYSAVKITPSGWQVEIKIPYSALRFSEEVDVWGINFIRRIHYLNEQYSWNYINRSKGFMTQYAGELTGISGINAPLRLSFSPYATVSNTWFEGKSSFDKSVGLDVKYGLSESFTLDATLIPDFSQTAFDNLELNLGPFEQRYEEQRAFFTEGTELFKKGNIFYSRRIGNAPVERHLVKEKLEDNEIITHNPDKVDMINAIKISGRTKKGLGIGFFNAITARTTASVRDTLKNTSRKIVTEPLANYNVLVLDQQFNKNSSVGIINTNVTRSGHFRDANVTALTYNISDKKDHYNIKGNLKISNVFDDGKYKKGYSGFIELSKIYGNFQFEVNHWRNNSKYEVKDLGFQRRNNTANYTAEFSYKIFEPNRTFNKYKISLDNKLKYLNNPNEYMGNEIELDGFFMLPSRFAFGGSIETNIGIQYDWFEPRVAGRYFKHSGILNTNAWVSSDYRKKFAYYAGATYGSRYGKNENYMAFNFEPRFRFSNRFYLIYEIFYARLKNEKGYVHNTEDKEHIFFGNRRITTLSNAIISKYNFNIKSALSLSFRHYWSPVKYSSNFFELTKDGNLIPSTYSNSHDENYNVWNLDLSYSWEFAPGSQFIIFYRNAITNKDNFSNLNYTKNLKHLFKQPISNNLSIKFIYYLDYNKLKTWL